MALHPILPVTNIAASTVEPIRKTAHLDIIDPTFMDYIVADCYVPIFFAYRLADKSEVAYSELLQRLKESLQKVLVPFFSFAGRWTAISTGSSQRKLLCNDVGVPFIEAYVGKNFDSTVQASAAFQTVPELQGYGVVGIDETQFKAEMQPDGLPPIFVQVSRFKCGSVVLAVTFNHTQTDAQGLFNFLTAWSDISRKNENETALTVDHNRAQADVPSMRALFANRDITKRSAAPSNGISGDPGGDGHKPPRLEMWAMKAFEVSAESIRSLKQELKGGNIEGGWGGGYVSTGDCIVAHLWKSLAAISPTELGGREPAVTRTVEGRTKFFDHPLPDLCGNVLTSVLNPHIPTAELLDMPLVSVARRLRDILQATRREEWLDMERYGKVLQTYAASHKFATMMITSWFKFPMYEMDFGFGKPFFASGPNSSPSLDAVGVTYIGPPIPNSPSSAATVYVWSTREVLHALENSPQFWNLFLSQK